MNANGNLRNTERNKGQVRRDETELPGGEKPTGQGCHHDSRRSTREGGGKGPGMDHSGAPIFGSFAAARIFTEPTARIKHDVARASAAAAPKVGDQWPILPANTATAFRGGGAGFLEGRTARDKHTTQPEGSQALFTMHAVTRLGFDALDGSSALSGTASTEMEEVGLAG